MDPLVYIVRPENFEERVVLRRAPFLLLCMPHGEGFPRQLEVIEAIAVQYQKELSVGVLAEESIELFKKKLNIIGSPTFLMMVEGKEVDRILGLIDKKTLTDLIDKHLPDSR